MCCKIIIFLPFNNELWKGRFVSVRQYSSTVTMDSKHNQYSNQFEQFIKY